MPEGIVFFKKKFVYDIRGNRMKERDVV